MVATCVILGALAWLVLVVLLGSGMRSAREEVQLDRAKLDRELDRASTSHPTPPPTPAPEHECDMRWN